MSLVHTLFFPCCKSEHSYRSVVGGARECSRQEGGRHFGASRGRTTRASRKGVHRGVCGPFCMPTFRITAVVPPALACESSCVDGSVPRLNEHDRGCRRAGGLSGGAVPRQHGWCKEAIYREASVAQVQAEQGSDVKGRDVSREKRRRLGARPLPGLPSYSTALQGREICIGKLYSTCIGTSPTGRRTWGYFSTSFHRRRLNSSLRVDRICRHEPRRRD